MMDFLKDDQNEYTLNQQRIKVLDRAIAELSNSGTLPIPLRVQLESLALDELRIHTSSSKSLENMKAIKTVLKRVGFAYLILVFIAILKRLSQGGGSGDGGSGGGSSSGGGGVEERVKKLRDNFREYMGSNVFYGADDVLHVVTSMPADDIPIHIRDKIVHIARACTGSEDIHVPGDDDFKKAFQFLKEHGKSLDSLQVYMVTHEFQEYFTTLFFDKNSENGTKLLREILQAIHSDLRAYITTYSSIRYMYEETIKEIQSQLDNPQPDKLFHLADMNSAPPTHLMSLIKKRMGNSSAKLDYGFIGHNKTVLLTALHTGHSAKLSEQQIKKIMDNRGHGLMECLDEHAHLSAFIAEIEHVCEGNAKLLEGADKAFFNAEEIAVKIKQQINDRKPGGSKFIRQGDIIEDNWRANNLLLTHSPESEFIPHSHNVDDAILEYIEKLRRKVQDVESDSIVIGQYITKLGVYYTTFINKQNRLKHRMDKFRMYAEKITDWVKH